VNERAGDFIVRQPGTEQTVAHQVLVAYEGSELGTISGTSQGALLEAQLQ
jgi:hypothetical protein